MSTVGMRNDAIRETSVDLELEAVVIAVADVDRSKEFYAPWGGDSTPTSWYAACMAAEQAGTELPS